MKLSFVFTLQFLHLLLFACGRESQHERYEVIIVGGGLAGLSTAHSLSGVRSYLLLEARDRLGGRVYTQYPYPGEEQCLDLGAHYILGEGRNTVHLLAKSAGRVEPGKSFFKPVLLSNGTQFDNGENTGMLLDYSDNVAEVSERFKQFGGSYWKFMKREMEYKLNQLEESGRSDKWLPLLERLLAALHYADKVENLSTKSLLEQTSYEGSKINTYKGGFQQILNEMNVDEKSVKTSKEVVKIEYGDDGVKVSCKDGSNYEGDRILVTLPLGVLKDRAHDLFHPALPEKKKKAIQALGFSNANKIFIEFEEPWWPKKRPGFYVAYTEETAKELTRKHGDWVLGMVDFRAAEGAPSFLTTWLTGKASTEMEKKSENEILEACADLLHKVFPNASRPLRVIRTKWESDPFSRGSHTYISTKADEVGAKIDDLAEPILNSKGKVVVAFAGEATSSNMFGTAHGAIASSMLAALQVRDPQESKWMASLANMSH